MISIAMTTYNGEKYLREQIDSILNQTYKDIELVICDDCSKDNTREILKEYEQKDSRIKIFFNEENLGFKKNFEKAISLCKGEYIAFSDQDDIWLPFKLERAISLIGDNDIYCSNAILVDQDNRSFGNKKKEKTVMKEIMNLHYIPTEKEILAKKIIHGNFCQGCTIVGRANFIKKYNYIPEEFEYHDWWFSTIASVNNGIIYDELPTLRYRQHGTNITTNIPRDFLETLSNTKYINTQKKFTSYIKRCNFISTSDLFPDWLQEYASGAMEYDKKMRDNKDFSTLKYYIVNYKYMEFDKNILHKFLFISKRFLGVIKFKLQSN